MKIWWNFEDTDNYYWLIPDWKNYLDYFLFMERWNKLVELVRSLPNVWGEGGERSDNLLEYMALAHLETIVEVQEQRRISLADVDALEEILLNGWGNERDTRIQNVKNRCLALVQKIVKSDREEQRSSDFLYWVTILFPWMADRVCSTHWLHDQVLQTWQEVLGKLGSAQREARYREEAHRALARQIRLYQDKPWIGSAIDLLEEMGDEESAEKLRDSSARAKSPDKDQESPDEDQRLYEMISELKRLGVPEEALDMLAKEGPRQDVVRQLQEARMPDEDLQMLLHLAESARARAADTATSLSSTKGLR